MPDTPNLNNHANIDSVDPEARPIEQNALLAALDNSGIHYYRFFPKEHMLVLPEATARAWASERTYSNVPEDQAFCAYLADEDKIAFIEMFHKVMDGAPTASSSFRLDEFSKWCRATMTTVAWDDDGAPEEAIVILEDRSEDMLREQLNRSRNESLSFMTQVFQIAALATDATVVIYDLDTNTTTAPESIASEWGVPAEHLNAPNEIANSEIVMPESKEAYLQVHEAIKSGAPEAKAKIKLREPNGEIGTYDMTFRMVNDAEGNPVGKAVGVYTNISDYEHRSQHQAAMSRALSQGINAAFYVNLDADTFMLEEVMPEYISESIRKFVEEEATSGNFSQVARLYCENMVSEEDRDRMLEELNAENIIGKLKDTPSYFTQYRLAPNPDGQEHFEMHIVSTDHLPGNNAFISFRCIDEQKARELQQQRALNDAFTAAQQASNAKSEFFSRMSHDIRTPMNAIIGMTALAATHIDDKSRVLDCLSKITISSQHLLGLINEVLDMSKIESGLVDLNVESFDLSKLVENLISMSHHMIEGYNHQLQVNVHDIEHEKVIGDPQRIQQAFMNLMSNAAKYTEPGGTIRLSITEKPVSKGRTGCYEFVFEDNGIGMTPEFVERIFEPFTRADDDLVNGQQGTGLGMSITHTIVQMMNGDIKVESVPGEGSKFTVTIFLELQDDEGEASLAHLENVPVLVVDDDELSCMSATSMLDDLGMRSEWVMSGEEAVEHVQSRIQEGDPYYAVIVDWKMPGMDGVATTRAIRKVAGHDIPIIIASAYDWTDIEAEAREAGVNGFLSKPLFRSRIIHQFQRLADDSVDESPSPVSAADALSQRSYSGKRVLLVEDNALNREIAVEYFEMAELDVEVAENGRQAVDMMESCEDGYYDMVFMDIQMPVMNGYDAARAIRSSNRNYLKSVPIVAMTADAFAEDVNASRSAGMNQHLAKPIDLDKLVGVLDRWLGRVEG